ncbi:mandelate racemase/muconate lactonizing enzyme family protein [Nonomuraea sp. NPDC049141]|uniref:mandelate racemase/muconate lactonizing enzyme family protein n=1 Tax=Nonomuraea sp. NPDC049141 TaxID=3155500 RepID=UPI0033D984CD
MSTRAAVRGLETIRCSIQPNVLLVRLHTDDGHAGLGESFFGAEAVEAYLHETVAPLLVGAPLPGPERLRRLLTGHVGFQGSGVETRGNGAVDLAVWDLLGRTTGQPVSTLLGGPYQDSLPVYNTCAGPAYVKNEPRQAVSNWGLATASPYDDLQGFLERPAELAKSLWDEGFRAMKVWPFDQAAERTGGTRLDRAELRAGLRVLDEIKNAVPEMEVMVELHGLWNLYAAAGLMRELERFAPFWVEDPLRADSHGSYATLQAGTSVPLATGETLTGQRSFRELLARSAIRVAIIDMGWSGGLTEARKIAALADSYDIPFAPHDCTGPISFAACVHLALSQPNTLVQESVRAFQHTWYQELATGLPKVENGTVTLDGRPGLGVELVPGLTERADVTTRLSGTRS